MRLIRLVFSHNPGALTVALLLSVVSALLSVGVVAFINERLVSATEGGAGLLWQFTGLLVVLLIIASYAQILLTALGHRFVYGLRRSMVKRVLDTGIERLEEIGGANILASLSSDIRNITLAFVNLPQLIYGLGLSVSAFAYLAYLSLPLFVMTLLWMTFTIGVGWVLIRALSHHLQQLRESEDRIYQDYEAAIEGRKELSLNRDRARRYYDDEFDLSAETYRSHVTLADRYHSIASNWANIMVLGTIGLVFYLVNGLGWAAASVAPTYALTILFMRTPLVSAVAALPALLSARVSLDKLDTLALAEYQPGFQDMSRDPTGEWQELQLHAVRYRYPAQHGEQGFDVGPVTLTIRRGETLFLVGGNGSGKSTLARLLSGLYLPHQGEIQIDGQPLRPEDWSSYRRLFGSVFTDFFLFDQLIAQQGQNADPADVNYWLGRLRMEDKVKVAGSRLQDTRLSQGQRKRLALLLALLEKRDILLLDEWAADQDPVFRRLFYQELLPEMKAQGKTIFAITHDDRYFHHADRLLKMDSGRLVELSAEDRQQSRHDALQMIGE